MQHYHTDFIYKLLLLQDLKAPPVVNKTTAEPWWITMKFWECRSMPQQKTLKKRKYHWYIWDVLRNKYILFVFNAWVNSRHLR